MILRDYQTKAVEDIRESYRTRHRAPLLVAPTGSGKTVIFSYIASNARGRVMILVHRQELIDQVSTTLGEFNVPHSFIAPGYPANPYAKVQVASVFSLLRRLSRPAPDLIVIDEAHHAIPNSSWGKVFDAYRSARLLGVTATPIRLSGEGLSPPFDDLILGPTVAELTDGGSLAPARVFAPPLIETAGIHTRMGDFSRSELESAVDKPKITGDAVEHYKRLADGKRAVVFCVSVQHATHVAQEFRNAGYRAVSLDGGLDRSTRRDVVRDYQSGNIGVLTSCDLISEGFDCPGIEVGVSLRPTQSLGLWLQQVGRCLRPGKPEAIIIDHAGNSVRHGLPNEVRDWSLQGIRRGKQNRAHAETAPSIRVCPNCFSAQESGRKTCIHCAHTFPIQARKVSHSKGELIELTPEQAAKAHAARHARQEVGMSKSLDDLIRIGTARKYRDPEAWGRYVLAGRAKKGKL